MYHKNIEGEDDGREELQVRSEATVGGKQGNEEKIPQETEGLFDNWRPNDITNNNEETEYLCCAGHYSKPLVQIGLFNHWNHPRRECFPPFFQRKLKHKKSEWINHSPQLVIGG